MPGCNLKAYVLPSFCVELSSPPIRCYKTETYSYKYMGNPKVCNPMHPNQLVAHPLLGAIYQFKGKRVPWHLTEAMVFKNRSDAGV